MDRSYDVIVAGLGAHGSAAAFHLARRGQRVLGFDRFHPPHDRGSTHGRTRVIRQAYAEGAAYVPLVQRAFQLWRELEAESGERLLHMTGGISVALTSGGRLDATRASLRANRLPFESMSAADIRSRWPVFRPEDTMSGIFETQNGALFPEKCVAAHLAQAAKAGAELRFDDAVQSWRAGQSGEGVEVRTASGNYRAAKLILTAGPWLPALLGGLELPLRTERQVLHWFEPARSAAYFRPDRMPTNSWEFEPGKSFYCQPDFGDGVKVAFHHMGAAIDPDSPPGSPARTVSTAEIDHMRRALARFVPDAAGRHLGAAVCIYTNTPDEHFLVDFHPEHRQVVIGSPCSGHGFKFASAMGEVLAGLATDGRTGHDIAMFGIARLLPARR
jgi:sarcosine oxidase